MSAPYDPASAARLITSLDWVDGAAGKILADAFGQRNFEEAMVFVTRMYDWHGKRVIIRPTPEMIRGILEAVHGRPDVGAAVIAMTENTGQIVRRGTP